MKARTQKKVRRLNLNDPAFQRKLRRHELLAALNQGASLQGHTIASISTINRKRARRWHPKGIEDWTILEWAGAMAGEAGEAANAAKKVRRLEQRLRQRKGPVDMASAIAKLAGEIADTYLYLDLMAARANIDLRAAIVAKFNEVSEREGFPERL
jgi:NTP pyrophosphatase (non-canonical NTP hydrolase)